MMFCQSIRSSLRCNLLEFHAVIAKKYSGSHKKVINTKTLNVGEVLKHPPPLLPLTSTPKEVSETQPFVIPNRIVRQDPGVVRLGFIPDEWFVFFFNKTGVSGFGTFCTTLSTFLVSKELYVLEEEFFTGISMMCLCVLGVKILGPKVAAYADKGIDEYEESLKKSRSDEVQNLEDTIKHEKHLQRSSEGQLILVEAKRENVDLQREDVYRKRLMLCYKETKKRLDYCVACEAVKKEVAQKHMVEWVNQHVMASISLEFQDKVLEKCMEDLILITKKCLEPSTTAVAAKPL